MCEPLIFQKKKTVFQLILGEKPVFCLVLSEKISILF